MALFSRHGVNDIEGVDSYNACYGGTAAVFNSVAWCQGEAWDGRYAIVVAVDIADLDNQHAFLNGAACVAMLIGPGCASCSGGFPCQSYASYLGFLQACWLEKLLSTDA